MSKRVVEAWVSPNLFEVGIGYVAVCRRKNNGEGELSVFLLDAQCLGVKNAAFKVLWASEIEDTLESLFQDYSKQNISPACARKLVESAVAYARNLGLPPHEDYHKACRVFGGIAPAECVEVFTFGKDGKPLYIRGPHDSDTFAQEVIRRLSDKCGPENFHYIVGEPFPDFGEDNDEEDVA